MLLHHRIMAVFSSIILLFASYSLTHILGVCSFPFSVRVSSPAIAVGIVCYECMVVHGLLFPRLLDCVFPYVLAVVGCCGIVLATIGPRTIQEVVSSPVKAVIVVLLHARNGFVLVLHWSGE